MNPDDREKRRTKILNTYKETGGIRATARKLKISLRVVRRVLRGKDLPPAVAGRVPRPSKLEAFKPVILGLVLEEHLTAILVLEEIKAIGYAGGYSILKDFVRTIRPAPKVKVTTVLEHPPGAEGQVDWSPYSVKLAGETRIVHAFSCVLPFSRYMVVRFAFDEVLDTLLLLHEEAFADIDGIPKLMTYDNMTTVGRHVAEDQIELNPRFGGYAKECGFDVWLIDPGRPNQHASVERPMHYIENNCLRRRRFTFNDLDDLNAHAKTWCATVANVRVHGTTRERPVDRLTRERAFLLPRPSCRPEPFHEVARGVGSDFCVRVDTNRYSVAPKHVGQPATVRLFGDRIEILVQGEIVAAHPLCRERHKRNVLPEHEEAFKLLTSRRQLLEAAFLRLGPAARDYYEGLRAQRGRGAGYHLQRILKLADRHGAAVVLGAIAHAARYGNYSAESVARVIAGREITRVTKNPSTTVPTPPDRVQRWLEGLDVENGDLADYDRLIDRMSRDEGDDDGER